MIIVNGTKHEAKQLVIKHKAHGFVLKMIENHSDSQTFTNGLFQNPNDLSYVQVYTSQEVGQQFEIVQICEMCTCRISTATHPDSSRVMNICQFCYEDVLADALASMPVVYSMQTHRMVNNAST